MIEIPELPLNVNALYEIDPVEVKASVDRMISSYNRSREDSYKAPTWLTPLYNEYIRKELKYYSTVRIAEFTDRGRNKYCLVYNNDFTQVTGGFTSLQKAALWFVRDGR